MKLHVVYDQTGRIVAAVRLDEDTTKESRFGRRVGKVRPIPKPGHRTAELDVPSEHSKLTFAEACQRLMVDPSLDRPYLKLRPR